MYIVAPKFLVYYYANIDTNTLIDYWCSGLCDKDCYASHKWGAGTVS